MSPLREGDDDVRSTLARIEDQLRSGDEGAVAAALDLRKHADSSGDFVTVDRLSLALAEQSYFKDAAAHVVPVSHVRMRALQSGDAESELRAIRVLAGIWLQFGDLLRSRALLSTAVERARETGRTFEEGIALANIGYTWAEQDEPEKYARYTREALAVFDSEEHSARRGSLSVNLAAALVRSGDLEDARQALDQARQLADSEDERTRIFVEIVAREIDLAADPACLEAFVETGLTVREKFTAMGAHYDSARQGSLIANTLVRHEHFERAYSIASNTLEALGDHPWARLRSRLLESVHQCLSAMGRWQDAYAVATTQCQLVQGLYTDEGASLAHQHSELATVRYASMVAVERRTQERALAASHRKLAAALSRERQLGRELVRAAVTDPLTGLHNRRGIDAESKRMLHDARASQWPLAVLAIDVDRFKQVNDTYGHEAGDCVLVCVADAIRAQLREGDCVGRFGGEEFVVVLADATVSMAHQVAERIRTSIADVDLGECTGAAGHCTVSVGVAPVLPSAEDVHEALRRADAALYHAKRSGRNRVVIAES